jgi:hypothetical protein
MEKLAPLGRAEKRLDVHEAVSVTILQHVMHMIDPPVTPRLRAVQLARCEAKTFGVACLKQPTTSHFSLLTSHSPRLCRGSS